MARRGLRRQSRESAHPGILSSQLMPRLTEIEESGTRELLESTSAATTALVPGRAPGVGRHSVALVVGSPHQRPDCALHPRPDQDVARSSATHRQRRFGHTRVQVDTKDELAELAASLNQMAAAAQAG